MGISADSAADSREFAAKVGIRFPLVADPGLAIARTYGVDDGEVAVPAIFVVDSERRIRWRYIGERPSDRPASARVIEALDSMGATRPTP